MKLTTERLELVPLTAEQLKLLLEDIPALERELDFSYKAEPVEGVFRDIVKGQLDTTLADPENYVWHTFFLMIRRSDKTAVGSADFKDVPKNGEVEIGYGLSPEFEHFGYMTETVGAMCGWALAQSGVSRVIAETELDNTASQRVLDRCGFSEYERGETAWFSLPARI